MSTDMEKAFPVSDEQSRGKVAGVFGGMDLRDYFAAKAMQGMLASGNQEATEQAWIAVGGTAAEGLAVASYGFADAMLFARLLKQGATQ